MDKTHQLFHLISYLQYPLTLVVLYFYVLLILSVVRGETDWAAMNNALIFQGILISAKEMFDNHRKDKQSGVSFPGKGNRIESAPGLPGNVRENKRI